MRFATQTTETTRLVGTIYDDHSGHTIKNPTNALTDTEVDAIRIKWNRLKCHEEFRVMHTKAMHQDEDCFDDISVTGDLN